VARWLYLLDCYIVRDLVVFFDTAAKQEQEPRAGCDEAVCVWQVRDAIKNGSTRASVTRTADRWETKKDTTTADDTGSWIGAVTAVSGTLGLCCKYWRSYGLFLVVGGTRTFCTRRGNGGEWGELDLRPGGERWSLVVLKFATSEWL
jgi:hypothetical protein